VAVELRATRDLSPVADGALRRDHVAFWRHKAATPSNAAIQRDVRAAGHRPKPKPEDRQPAQDGVQQLRFGVVTLLITRGHEELSSRLTEAGGRVAGPVRNDGGGRGARGAGRRRGWKGLQVCRGHSVLTSGHAGDVSGAPVADLEGRALAPSG